MKQINVKVLVATRSISEREEIAEMVKADRREKHLRKYPMIVKQFGKYC